MARGDHPERTPVYGFVLILAALSLIWLGSSTDVRVLSIGLYVLGSVVAVTGCLMTFRDYSF